MCIVSTESNKFCTSYENISIIKYLGWYVINVIYEKFRTNVTILEYMYSYGYVAENLGVCENNIDNGGYDKHCLSKNTNIKLVI